MNTKHILFTLGSCHIGSKRINAVGCNYGNSYDPNLLASSVVVRMPTTPLIRLISSNVPVPTLAITVPSQN